MTEATKISSTSQSSQKLVGKPLFEKMLADFDYGPVRWTIRRYEPETTEAQADEMIEAFLQWISLTPLNTKECYMVMFKTPVEEAFHNFVLNTRIYGVFCEQFLGYFFHHEPLMEENNGPQMEKIAKYTVEMLEEHFGDSLNPLLKDWRVQFDNGTYHIACAGPGGHC